MAALDARAAMAYARRVAHTRCRSYASIAHSAFGQVELSLAVGPFRLCHDNLVPTYRIRWMWPAFFASPLLCDLEERKLVDNIITMIRVQKLSMPGTGGEPAGSPFCFSGRTRMPKEFLAYQQQMEKLRSSGLTIEDKGACCRVLADIDYFLVVNGYQSFFRDPSTRVYREGATFGDILALYEFDVELREIMLDALLKVEAKLVKCVNGCLLSDESVGDERLLEAMSFPAEWKKITRCKIWDRPA